ncbi:hypothetical protein M9Y10_014707 [Tritrichomonas musculus]|uniref:Myotubularin phosphatase domain-containing protein n=1 Tax=Tritrichomonas musculus TaxID=1915356 RepID=A0ABR2L086_9EUKA
MIQKTSSVQCLIYKDPETKLKSAFSLLPNEKIELSLSFKLQTDHGTLYITNWAIRFVYDQPISDPSFQNFVIPLKLIKSIAKKGGKKVGKDNYSIIFNLSNGGRMTFPFPIVKGLRKQIISQIYMLKENVLELDEYNWAPDPSWISRLKNISGYSMIKNDFCDLYPPYILAPDNAIRFLTHDNMKSTQIIPILSYIYDPSNSKDDKIPLLRSAQPFSNSELKSNHNFLKYYSGSHDLNIFDFNQKTNSKDNNISEEKANDSKHSHQIISVHIPSLKKLRECLETMINCAFSGSEKSYEHWGKLVMKYVRQCSVISSSLFNKKAVLIHSSDNWERTAALSSLTQVFIDPYCRTIKGFAELIQREWIDSGHMFAHINPEEESPIFPLFIDGVAQIMIHFPNAFEYNMSYLDYILSNSYAKLFGDFVGNCYQMRASIKRPVSLFECVFNKELDIIDKITNSDYTENNSLLKIKDDDENYTFVNQLMGTPAFFTDKVPVVTVEPPPPHDYSNEFNNDKIRSLKYLKSKGKWPKYKDYDDYSLDKDQYYKEYRMNIPPKILKSCSNSTNSTSFTNSFQGTSTHFTTCDYDSSSSD